MHPRGKTTNMVPAIGMDKAIRIFYKANVDILTTNSNYAAMRTAMVSAAQQLGYDQATQDAVACAYAAIAVGTAPASCGGGPPPGDTVLTNGTAVSASDSVVGNFKFYKLTVPAG
jgi:vibriolysin